MLHILSPAQIPNPPSPLPSNPRHAPTKTKIGVAIHQILEEDTALRFSRDPQTKEISARRLRSAAHRSCRCKTRKRYHVDLTLKPPKFLIEKPFAGVPMLKANTRNSPAAHANSASVA